MYNIGITDKQRKNKMINTIVTTKDGRINIAATVRDTVDMLLKKYDDVNTDDVMIELAAQGNDEITESQVRTRLSQNFYHQGNGYYSHNPEWHINNKYN